MGEKKLCTVVTYPNTKGPDYTQTEILVYQTARYFMPEEYLYGYIKSIPLLATIHRMDVEV